jgi:hypothetical protein
MGTKKVEIYETIGEQVSHGRETAEYRSGGAEGRFVDPKGGIVEQNPVVPRWAAYETDP